MSTTTPLLGTSTAITITLTGLAASATVGRQCTVFTTSGFDDVKVTIGVATNATAPASSKACYVYFFESEDGTNYNMDDAAPGASDAGYTINAASNLKGPGVISCPTASKTYRGVFDLSQFFTNMPRTCGFVVCNDTANVLGATAIGCSYTGYNETIA